MSEILNTLIIGSGPAGYTAAIYACRAQLEPVLVCGSEVGGQLTTTPEIENWPSRFDAPDGFSLMQDMSKHAEKLGTKFIYDEVVKTDFSKNVKEVYLSSGTVLKAKTVIIATGAKARYLGLESETKYKGKGVSACATCDGFFFRGKEVAVVGGGSAAFIEALYLANLCSKVYLIHRRAEFRAEKVLVDRLRKLEIEGKVEFVLNANIKEILGDGNLVNGVRVESNGQNRDIALSGVFMAIGHEPSTKPFAGQIELYDDGTVKTNLCSKVYLIHRRAEFRAEKVLVDRLRKLEIEGKVEFVLNANIKEILGDGNLVNGVRVESNGQNRDIALSGVFMAIGHEPSTKPFAGQIELYDDGTVKTGFTSETSTSVAGVFAAGDCADRVYRQAITSAGQGCKAALDAEKYLQSKL